MNTHDNEFTGNPALIEAKRHSALRRWSNFFESAAEERAFFAADRQRDRMDDARDQEQAAIDAHPNWERDFDADRRERESALVPLTAEAIERGEAELKRLMDESYAPNGMGREEEG